MLRTYETKNIFFISTFIKKLPYNFILLFFILQEKYGNKINFQARIFAKGETVFKSECIYIFSHVTKRFKAFFKKICHKRTEETEAGLHIVMWDRAASTAFSVEVAIATSISQSDL